MLLDTYFYHLLTQYLHILVKILFNSKSLNPEERKKTGNSKDMLSNKEKEKHTVKKLEIQN